jgi:hypothetical protein
MVIELLDDAIPPWLRKRNEPEMGSIMEAETNQGAHASWMGWAAVKGQFIVHLKVLWDAHTQPECIKASKTLCAALEGIGSIPHRLIAVSTALRL